MKKYDFGGWATVNNLKCSDGRTIMKDAFAHNDGQTVPLVWNHQHNDPLNILGHALLENRDKGVYAYCTFNDTESGQAAKKVVEHGDVVALSIYANKLKQQGGNVLHGVIREVSLVLAGANPGAFIDSVISHGEESDEEAVLFTDEFIELHHAEDEENPEKEGDENVENEEIKHADEQSVDTKATENKEVKATENKEAKPTENKEETVQEVFDTLTEKQKNVVYAIIGEAVEEAENKANKENEEKEGENKMKHNVFENENKDTTLIHKDNGEALTHSDVEAIFNDAKRYGSLKDATLAHGVTGIDTLFPEDKFVGEMPAVVKREDSWVADFMGKVHKSPFSRIKSIYANLTEEDARAKGYFKKGTLKKEQFFSMIKRNTAPTTIYKKQKLDRDDLVDITNFDIVAFIKMEMREMLEEEIARACLIGDGRAPSSDDKINELNIRPIWTDEEAYTIRKDVNVAADADADTKVKAFIRAAVKARKEYKGSGNPTLYTTEDLLTDCLLLEDKNGRVIYDTVDKLANALRVKSIVTVEVMENQTRDDSGVTKELMAIIVNPKDYNIGADKGGAVNMFDDFDIDYNQQKYLIETRCSGALVKPYSAIVLELNTTNAAE